MINKEIRTSKGKSAPDLTELALTFLCLTVFSLLFFTVTTYLLIGEIVFNIRLFEVGMMISFSIIGTWLWVVLRYEKFIDVKMIMSVGVGTLFVMTIIAMLMNRYIILLSEQEISAFLMILTICGGYGWIVSSLGYILKVRKQQKEI